MRKSFDDAANKAEIIKAAAELRREKNAGIFTASQENFRKELGLARREVSAIDRPCLCCDRKTQMRPSRSHLRVRLMKFN